MSGGNCTDNGQVGQERRNRKGIRAWDEVVLGIWATAAGWLACPPTADRLPFSGIRKQQEPLAVVWAVPLLDHMVARILDISRVYFGGTAYEIVIVRAGEVRTQVLRRHDAITVPERVYRVMRELVWPTPAETLPPPHVNRLAQPYGGYLSPGSTLDELRIFISQWNNIDPRARAPYRMIQFAVNPFKPWP